MFVQESDADILKWLEAGNARGMTALFDRYYRPLVLFADQLLHDIAWAEDVVQEQFVKFWEGELFVGLSSKALSTYLFTITKNACCNALERRGIKTVDLSEGLHVAAQEEAEELDEKTVQIVRQALGQLPQRMREVVCCVICDGYSYAEAAVKLGISINTVKTSLRKGMKELRGMLENRSDLILLVLCGRKMSK